MRAAERALLVAIALLQLTESLAVVVAFYLLTFESRTRAIATTVLLALVFAGRRALTAVLARTVRERLIDRTASAVLRTELTRGSLLPGEDATFAILEGLYVAERTVAEVVPGLAAALAASAVLSAVAFRFASLRLIVTGAFAVGAAAAVSLAARGLIAKHAASALTYANRVHDGIIAAVNARIDLVANGCEQALLSSLRSDARAWGERKVRADFVSGFAGRAAILAAALAVAALAGVDATFRGEILASSVLQSAMYASAVPPFLALARLGMQLVKEATTLRPLAELLDAERAPQGASPGTPLPSMPAPVEWRGVTVRFPGDDGQHVVALDDVSVDWPQGQLLLVVGPNGSGKSTLLRLLLGLFAPSVGTVTVGSADVLSLDLRAWRSRAAYLGQRPYILDRATVRETLHALAPAARDEDMRRALERFEIWSELAKKDPEDPLSAHVGVLSVGQRQRVALARVLVQDASVIVLDEPDANLDAAGVAIVAAVVKELSRDRMVVVAAHTPELTAAGDMVVELDRGAVKRVERRADRGR
jgi:ABC-type multidrug transport system fused ATPase/permease subunit